MKLLRLTAGLSLILVLNSCQNPLEGVVLRFKDPLTRSTVQIQYTNANSSDTARLPRDLKIRLAGPGAPQLVNLTGGTYLAPSREGLLGLAVSPAVTPTAQQPVRFSVVAETAGFATKTVFLSVSDEKNQRQTVRLFRFSNPPQSVSLAQETVGAGTLTLTTPLVNGKRERATAALPAGTGGLDAAGKPVGGSWYLTLFHFDNRSGAAEGFTPGGYTSFHAYDRSGRRMPAFRFRPAGFFAFDAATTDGAQAVAAFSQPVPLTVELNPDTYFDSGRLAVGDSLQFWRYDETNGSWRELRPLRVERGTAGQPFVRASIDRVAHYALAEPSIVCEQGPVFRFQTDLTNVDLTYYAQFVDAETGAYVSDTWLDLNNGAQRGIGGMARRTLRLKIFNYTSAYGGDRSKPIFTSEPFDNCTYREISVKVTVPKPPPIRVEFKFVCPQGTRPNDAFFPATLHIQYRPTGTTDWLDLAQLSRAAQQASTYKLRMGKRYAFRGSANPSAGWPFFQKDTTLTQPVYLFKFEGGDACK
jgi:hypothetical protein